MVDYYRTLEVSRNASTSDIKKAYKRLALKWHPDKNPDNLQEATRKFTEISEAYEVLVDEKKRRVYDQYGKEGLSQGGRSRSRHEDFGHHSFNFPFTFRDPEEVFREFFSGSDFSDLFGLSHGHRHGNRGSSNTSISAQFYSPFGAFNFDDLLGMNVNSGFTSFSSLQSSNVGSGVKRTSTSTRFINGKKITTKKIVENGRETVMTFENDTMTSKTVNGVTQALT